MRGFDHDNRRVLIVDDQAEIHEDFREILPAGADAGASDELAAAFLDEERPAALPRFDLFHASSGDEALRTVREAADGGRPIALAYVDIRMPPGIDGVETIRRIRKFERNMEVVVMTAYTDQPLSRTLLEMDLLHKLLYVRKPFSREVIQQLTVSLVAKWNIERELAERSRQLAAGHRRLEAVLDATGDAMAMYDADERLVFANRPYEVLLGAALDELRGLRPEVAEERFTPCLTPFGDAGQGLLAGGGELVEPAGEAAGRIFHRSRHAVRDGAGETLGRLVAYRDLGKEVEIERMKVEVVRLRSELERQHASDGLIGESPAMRRVSALVEQAADSDVAVLITGESGTGKELVARALHENGPRSSGPFVAINCAALPEGLIESELFGHEQGAFTGAEQQRIGAFERADGGTLFLDEIVDLKPSLQAKLLRTLEEKEVLRLGAAAPSAIDARVVAATNRVPSEAVSEGSFREDLFYRIAAFPIPVPPLRERREDIPALALRFLSDCAGRAGKSIGGFSPAAMRLLLGHDWPGNVRELRNAVERAVVLETDRAVSAGNLPSRLAPPAEGAGDVGGGDVPARGAGTAATRGAADSGDAGRGETVPAPGATDDGDAGQTLAEVERAAIDRALEAAGGNMAAAARALGIDRTTLYRKLRKDDTAG